jgi:hypothetical protein
MFWFEDNLSMVSDEDKHGQHQGWQEMAEKEC